MNRSNWLAGFLLLGSALSAQERLDARALGVTEAVLDYCAKNDPMGADKVLARLKRLTQGSSPEALGRARNSPEYQAARQSELDFIGRVDPHNATKLCSEPVARSK